MNSIKSKTVVFLVLIVFLAAFLRISYINNIPVSLYWDEAASGYNAYSILHTGKDEYGTSFPFLFRSFNDYKMPAHIYLTALSVFFFGLNEFSVRFPSALLGTATVFLTFFLVDLLLSFKNKTPSQKYKSYWDVIVSGKGKTICALLVSFFFAISPWHIQFSRTGFEANMGLFFVILGFVLFLQGMKKQNNFLIFSGFVFSLSFYFYRSIHVFLPLMLFIAFIVFKGELLQKSLRRKTILGFVVFLLVLLPILPKITSHEGLIRAQQVNIFNNANKELDIAAKEQLKSGNTFIGKIVHNRRFVYPRLLLQNYVLYYTPKYLFFEGDGNGRHGVLGMGLLYLWEVPFILLGIILLFFSPLKTKILIFAWLVFAPLPAAVSYPSPHALRSLNILPIPQLLTTFGVIYCFLRLKNLWRYIYTVILGCIILISFFYYTYLYFFITPPLVSREWADGYKQLALYIFVHEKQYEKVVISGHYWQPYIYFLFYKKYDPSLYQKYGSKQQFGKYLFGGTRWDISGVELDEVDLVKFAGTKETLYALSPVEYEKQKAFLKKLAVIKNHRNETIFIVVEMKDK